jgi:hypothetical protein
MNIFIQSLFLCIALYIKRFSGKIIQLYSFVFFFFFLFVFEEKDRMMYSAVKGLHFFFILL